MNVSNYKKPENCTTVWELQQNYCINKQKIYRAIHANKLNAFMIKVDGWTSLKWYIKNDELLLQFIKLSEKQKKFGEGLKKLDEN